MADKPLSELSFEELLEKSSLGTPGAKRLRARTSPDVAAEIVKRASERVLKRHANLFRRLAEAEKREREEAKAQKDKPR